MHALHIAVAKSFIFNGSHVRTVHVMKTNFDIMPYLYRLTARRGREFTKPDEISS